MDPIERVQRQQARLFDEVLPAFIDRFFSGDGHELRFHLKDASARHDLSAIDGAPPPGDDALERAHFVRVNCPVDVWPDAPNGETWLADYLQTSLESGGVVLWTRRVVVLASVLATHDDDELFWALFDAYGRYFDAMAGETSSTTSHDARKRDTRARVWRATKWIAGATVVLTCAIVAAASAPSDEPRRPTRAAPATTSANEQRARDDQAAAALSRRIHDAAARQLGPREAMDAIGGAPLLPDDPLMAHLALDADPDVAGAQAAPADAVLTLLWLRPGAFSPLRFSGLTWDALGVVHVVDVSDANSLAPVAHTTP